MKKLDALEYFGSQTELAKAARVTPQAVNQWGDRVPEACAARLDKETDGELDYNPNEYS